MATCTKRESDDSSAQTDSAQTRVPPVERERERERERGILCVDARLPHTPSGDRRRQMHLTCRRTQSLSLSLSLSGPSCSSGPLSQFRNLRTDARAREPSDAAAWGPFQESQCAVRGQVRGRMILNTRECGLRRTRERASSAGDLTLETQLTSPFMYSSEKSCCRTDAFWGTKNARSLESRSIASDPSFFARDAKAREK